MYIIYIDEEWTLRYDPKHELFSLTDTKQYSDTFHCGINFSRSEVAYGITRQDGIGVYPLIDLTLPEEMIETILRYVLDVEERSL